MKYYRYLYCSCRRVGVHSKEEFLEVYQELVSDLLERLPGLPERIRKSFPGFLYWRMRVALGRVRATRRPREEPLRDMPASRGIDRHMMRESIDHCRETLTHHEQEVFELRYVQEMSLRETAQALGSNVNAVSQTVFRLIRKIRECLRRAGFE